MPVRYGTPQEELAICLAWRARLEAELADVTEIIEGLEGTARTENGTTDGARRGSRPLAHVKEST